MSSETAPPLILLPGLAANAEMFRPQRVGFPQLIVPPWPDPQPGESLADYGRRLADDLRPHAPCVLGGASFGGMVAQEVACHLQPRAVILIGSVRSPAEFPRYVRCGRALGNVGSWIPVRLLQGMLAPATTGAVRKVTPFWSELASQIRSADPRLFRWSVNAVLRWQGPPPPPCPVYQIHGDRDRVLPVKRTRPDRIVSGGGHLISLSKPREVNEFIRTVLARCG